LTVPDDGIAEHLAVFRKAAVGGQDHRAALIAGVDQLEEQVAAALDDRQVADLIDDQQRRPAEEPDPLPQVSFPLRLGQRADDVGQGREVDAAPGLDRLDAERTGQMALAGARRGSDILPGTRVKT
jgi:hypothetical protein